MLSLYGPDVLTPNTHWTLHLIEYVRWYSIPRGYWTFPQESILSLVKKATRKMTNHRAVAFSCARLFVLERLLSQVLYPAQDIPKRCVVFLFVSLSSFGSAGGEGRFFTFYFLFFLLLFMFLFFGFVFPPQI